MSVAAMKRARNPEVSRPRLRLSCSVVVEPDGDEFHAYCPAFKGLHVDGGTQNEALANALRAVQVYIESLIRNREPLPVGPDLEVLEREELPHIPEGAFLHHIEFQWPFQNTSGNS
jgi:predicted RNase H-like HicB family nuclease